LGIILAGLAVGLGSRWWLAVPDGLLVASGRIEGDEVMIAPKISGRVLAVTKNRGDMVAAGEVLVQLTSDQIQAQLDRAREQERYWQERVRQAWVEMDYTAGQVPAEIAAAEARLAAAQARVQEAEAELAKHSQDFRRYEALFARQVIPAQKRDEVAALYQAASARRKAAQQEAAQARALMQQARLLPRTVELKRQEWQSAQANLAAAQAAVREAQANLADTVVLAPCHGILLTRTVEPGEVVTAGTPLFSLVDLQQLYLKVFINEPDIGKIRLGQEARIYVDAFPDRPFRATVSRVSPRAEFTPKYVETREERVKLVFAVELRAENPEGYLKPGMPGEAVLRWQDGVPWRPPR